MTSSADEVIAVDEAEAPANADVLSVTVEQVTVSVSRAAPEVEELVGRAKEGDRTAFASLYRMYLPTVYKFLFYRVGSKPQAEDMTAEVFLRALRKIEDFTWTGADFGAWLLRIARNLILDDAKSSRTRLEVLNDEMPEDSGGEAPTAEAACLENLTCVEVYKAITKLRPDQREVITLRFLQGMGVGEVAEIMGKKEGTVRTLQFRGLKSLEKILVARGVVDVTVSSGIRPDGVRLSENGRGEGRTESEAARFGVADGQR